MYTFFWATLYIRCREALLPADRISNVDTLSGYENEINYSNFLELHVT